jgi:hypothetical protein
MPSGIAVADAELFFTLRTNTNPPGSVHRIPKAGGTVTSFAQDQGGPVDIVVDATNV